jgi:GxxExxY protein
MVTQKHINDISFKIIGCAIEVHKHLGPGLMESVYEPCLVEECLSQGLDVKTQVWVPINYKNKNLGGKLKLDLLIDDLIIVELKAVEAMIPLYQAQLLSYLRLADKPKGLLINFHCENISKQMVSLVADKISSYPKS